MLASESRKSWVKWYKNKCKEEAARVMEWEVALCQDRGRIATLKIMRKQNYEQKIGKRGRKTVVVKRGGANKFNKEMRNKRKERIFFCKAISCPWVYVYTTQYGNTYMI